MSEIDNNKKVMSKDHFFNSINLGIKDVLILNGCFVVFVVIYVAIYLLVRKVFGSQIVIEYRDVLFYIFFGIVIYLVYKYKLKDFKFFGFQQSNLRRNIKFVLSIIFFFYFTKFCVQLLMGKYLILANDEDLQLFTSHSGWIFFLHSTIALSVSPIMEEILFRGFLYPPLRRRFNVHSALIINSLIFTLWHFSFNVKGLIVIFLTGMLLVYIYERTMSLIPSIIAHAIINFSWIIAISYKYLESEGKAIIEPARFLLLLACVYLLLSLLFYIFYKRDKLADA